MRPGTLGHRMAPSCASHNIAPVLSVLDFGDVSVGWLCSVWQSVILLFALGGSVGAARRACERYTLMEFFANGRHLPSRIRGGAVCGDKQRFRRSPGGSVAQTVPEINKD